MALYKVLLYYCFTPLADPDAIRLWQRDVCESLGLGGRIIIAPHGINGTVGGELNAVKKYWRKTREYPAFRDIDFKWSEGSGPEDFPRLSVRVRDELVGFGAPEEVVVGDHGVTGGGQHLSPEQLHELVETKRSTSLMVATSGKQISADSRTPLSLTLAPRMILCGKSRAENMTTSKINRW